MATNETNPHPRRVPPQKSEPPSLPSLGDTEEGKDPGLGRALVCIRQCRAKLLDPDNLVGSVKSLLDGLVEAGLIRGDSANEIVLEVDQVKVPHRDEQKTEIEIFTNETPRLKSAHSNDPDPGD